MTTDQRGKEDMSTHLTKMESESEKKAVSKKRDTGPDENGTTQAESTKRRNTVLDRSVKRITCVSNTNLGNDEKRRRYPDLQLEDVKIKEKGGKNTPSSKLKYDNKHTKEYTSSGEIDINKAQTGVLREVACLKKLPSEENQSSIKTPQQTYELDERDEQIFATLYGQCIGDAIGLLTEFMSKKEAYHHYGHKAKLEYGDKIEDRHRTRWKVGDWTDDSDQMILIMQSLIGKDGVVNPKDFARRLVRWRENGFKDLGDTCGMGIGHTTYVIISRNDFEQYPDKVSKAVWEESGGYLAPNGGVMRTCILGIHDWWDRNKVYANAIDICKTTHSDPRCQASVVAVCTAISLMLQRGSRHLKQNGEYIVETLIEDAFGEASTCLESKEAKQSLWKCLQCEQLSELNLDEENAIGYTYKCLGAGFWALKQNDFRKALQEVVLSGGDADTNAAVAGALLGCKLGNKKPFPETWLKLEHKYWLDEQIQKYLTVLKKRQEDWTRVFGKEQSAANMPKSRETAI